MLRRQEGLVSFLVVMFISVLLVLISASFAQVMIRELRQSTDSELSVRAFYAAEAGIEDGILRIKRAVEAGDIMGANEPNCTATTPPSTSGYSCRLITVAPHFLEGSLRPDMSRRFNLEGVSHTSIRLNWHEYGANYETGNGSFTIPSSNPTAGNWPDQTPPIMRLEVISYPVGSDFSDGDIEQRVAFLRPINSDAVTTNIHVNNDLSSPGANTNRSVACNRQRTSGFACSATITGMSTNRNYMVNIKPFYAATNYRLEAFSGGNTQAIPGNMAIIDVTGYANDVYRRVQMRLPLFSVDTFGQDYVLLADDDLCKVMRVSQLDDRASTNTGCEPLSVPAP